MDLKKKVVLIIEDNEDFLESTAEILEFSNFTTYTANCGKKGIEQACLHKPDLILCDVKMPDLDGYQVLNVLSRNDITANIPFIFLSSMSERTDIRKGMDLGADDYLTKPYDEEELLNAIEARLQKRDRILKSTINLTSLENLIDEAIAAKLLVGLSEGSRLRTFSKKQKVYVKDDRPESVYLVKSGKIKAYRIYTDGREMITEIYSAGDFFGYESVLLNKPYYENAEALDSSELYLIPRTDFNSVLYKDIRIAKKFIELLSGNVVNKQEQLLKLAYNSVKMRVADALVHLAPKYCTGDPCVCEIKITRDGLAAMVGTAIETVSRALADLKEEKIIEKEGSKIRILSLEKLKQIK